MSARTDCELRELDGRPLGWELVMFTAGEGAEACVVVAPPQPGRIIQHCLVEGLRDVVIAIGPAAQPARVDRLTFSPDYGRVCVRYLPAPFTSAGSQHPIR